MPSKLSKTQQLLKKEYDNLLRRTKQYKGTHIEVDNNISLALEQARSYISKKKLTQRDVSDIKKLASSLHGLRGEALRSQYVEKPQSQNNINTEGNIASEDILADLIIDSYRNVLKRICTNPETGEVIQNVEKSYKGITGHGLFILESQLDKAISERGKIAVAKIIIDFEPPTGDGWFYDSHEHFEFISRMFGGQYDVSNEWSDEEIAEYYGQ